MEYTYLQHEVHLDMNCLCTVPLILCLSCNKLNCWKQWNALFRKRCYRESTYCQSTDTERHMWDSINCAISAEWRTQKLWPCWYFKFYKYFSTFQGHNFHVTTTVSYIKCFQVKIKQMWILSKDFWPLTNTNTPEQEQWFSV